MTDSDSDDTYIYIFLFLCVVIPLKCCLFCCLCRRRSQRRVTLSPRRVIVRHVYHVDEQPLPSYQPPQTSVYLGNPPPYLSNPV